MTPIPKTHDALAQAADDNREKLVRTIARLDRRGHRAADAAKRVGGSLRDFRFGRASLALVGACVTVLAFYEVVSRRKERRPSRWRALASAWRRPDRERPAKRPFLLEVGRSLLVSLVASALAAPLRRIAGRRGE